MARAAELIELSTIGDGTPFDDFLYGSLGWFEGPGIDNDIDTKIVERGVALLVTQFQDID
ncbi:MAG: hypothetical protein V3V00_15935 [Saprospiraceae bacterium]